MRALQLALADFKERRRRYSFFITIAVTLYLAFLFVPPVGAEFYYTLTLHKYRGIYNSPWVGTVIAISLSSFLTLFGFYLCKNTVARDRRSGVGELLAATTLSKTSYVFSKFLSNLLFLTTIAAPLVVMAAVLQLLRAEDVVLRFGELATPFLYLTLPNLIFVSGAAVLFESTPGLRRGFGNVIYFYVYMPLLIVPIEMGTEFDLLGIAILEGDMHEAFAAVFPDRKAGFSLGHIGEPLPEGIFAWDGVVWTGARIWARSIWLGVALVFTLTGVLFFDRFDPARLSKGAQRARSQGGGRLSRFARTLTASLLHVFSVLLDRFRFGRIVLAELRLALFGLPAFWYLIALGLWVASVVTPIQIAGRYLMPALWILPILVWSQSGVRERLRRVDQILFATPHPVFRQALGVWGAGVLVAMLLASGYGARLIVGGEYAVLFALFAGSLFVPSLALTCGVLTQSARTFEILYLLLWYIGPLNNVHALDYIGVYPETIAMGMPQVYFGLSAGMLALALGVRMRQAQG